MNDGDALLAAVDDVSTVAKQLREVKRRIEQYGEAAARLDKVASAVEQLSKSIAVVQAKFSELLLGANSVLAAVERQRSDFSSTAASIPEVVERIASLDVSKDIHAVLDEFARVRRDIGPDVAAIASSQQELASRFAIQERALEAVAAQVEQEASRMASVEERLDGNAPLNSVLERLGAIELAIGSQLTALSERNAAAEKAATTAAGYAHRCAQMLVEIGKRVVAMEAVVESNSKSLAILKERKGIIF